MPFPSVAALRITSASIIDISMFRNLKFAREMIYVLLWMVYFDHYCFDLIFNCKIMFCNHFVCVMCRIFSSPVRSTGSKLMSSPVYRWHPMLTFAFRSNVDKLLGPD